MGHSIYDSKVIFNSISKLGIEKVFRRLVLRHIMSILIAVLIPGYKGKTTHMSAESERHRTTIAHFLNRGKWDDDALERAIKQYVIQHNLFRSGAHREAGFLYSGRYDILENKAFVTGFTPN